MLFGYLIVRALLILVRVFGLLPDGASRAFARLLDSVHRDPPGIRPGGAFRFVEHGLAPDPGVAGLQQRLTPLQRRAFGGWTAGSISWSPRPGSNWPGWIPTT
jgi:hypothetical protein